MDIHDQNNQNRLLISTFIVATAIAIYFSGAALPIRQGSIEFFVVGILFLSIVISASLSLLYILAKGYELRYRKDDKKNFIDKHNYHLYNWSIKSYPWTIGLLTFTILCDYLKKLPTDSELWTTTFLYMVAFLFLAIFGGKSIVETYRMIRKKNK